MIKPSTFASLLVVSALLTGCCPNGCFVVHGDLYERLAHPKPYIENWEKLGADSAVRAQDAINCNSAFRFVPQFIAQEQVEAARRADETENDTYHRLMYDWQRCMIRKGYRYTGYCSAGYAKVAPACGAP